ncbi:transposable element Tc1 transposase [Trichonephila clavipes]|nr:transposable element Tc1 transposase [Trichonephila clavipes]
MKLAVDTKLIYKDKGNCRHSRLIKQNWRSIQCKSRRSVSAQRTLLDMGLHSKCPTRVSLLTKCYCQQHLQWAQEHQAWTMDKRKSVVQSYESGFLIHHVDGCIWVHCLPSEQGLRYPSGQGIRSWQACPELEPCTT